MPIVFVITIALLMPIVLAIITVPSTAIVLVMQIVLAMIVALAMPIVLSETCTCKIGLQIYELFAIFGHASQDCKS